MSELPSGWAEAEIGSLCLLQNGRAFKPSEWGKIGLPIVRIQNLNKPDATFNYYAGEISEKNRLKGRELLFAWSGTPGTSFGAHIWSGGDAVLNQHIFRVDFDEAAFDKRFFRHAINQCLSELIDIAHGGVGLRHVTKGKFESTQIAVAPFPEQKRIADKLDTLLARIDACRDRLNRVQKIIKQFRQSVLSAAISGRLTEEWREETEAVDWQQTDVQSVAHVGTGSTPLRSNSTFFASTGTPWVTSAATSQALVTEAGEFVTQTAITAHRLKTYPIGTLLVAMYGEGKTRGQVTELGISATINQACAAIVVNEEKVIKNYLKLALQANYFEMRELAEGGNQPNLNLSKIKKFSLPLPSMVEQIEIVRRVEHLFSLADRLEARVKTARARVDTLTPATLAKAFRGELVPQDPNDEPASALLERIRAKKEATPAPRGKGKKENAKIA